MMTTTTTEIEVTGIETREVNEDGRPEDRYGRPMLAVGFDDNIERETEKAVLTAVSGTCTGASRSVWMPKSQLCFTAPEADGRRRLWATEWIVSEKAGQVIGL